MIRVVAAATGTEVPGLSLAESTTGLATSHEAGRATEQARAKAVAAAACSILGWHPDPPLELGSVPGGRCCGLLDPWLAPELRLPEDLDRPRGCRDWR